ncbi:MAG: hypothetical protein DWH94_03850 [Planctomycetota bacterium]|nr:MAG: hypothetical protein DWH94_03850 [Planctomycetota bacterium]
MRRIPASKGLASGTGGTGTLASFSSISTVSTLLFIDTCLSNNLPRTSYS